MKLEFREAYLEIIVFDTNDIITTSSEDDNWLEEDELV